MAVAAVNTCFILSMTYTTVANTMFVLSAAPFFTALLGWLVLRETVERGVWIAMCVALTGIGVMLWDGLGAGALLGNALAVMAAFCFGTFVVVLRKGRAVNMLPVVILGTILGALNAAFMSGWRSPFHFNDVALLFIWGALLSGVVHVIFAWSSRHVPGAELTLLNSHRVHPLSDVGVAPRRRGAEPGHPDRRGAGHRLRGEPCAHELSGPDTVTNARRTTWTPA